MVESAKQQPPDPVQQLIQVAAGYVLSSVLNAITEAGVADQLVDGPRTCEAVAGDFFESGNAPDFGKVMDIEMLALPGGRERTAEEFARLFAGAGFELTSITPTKSPISVIEARPK